VLQSCWAPVAFAVWCSVCRSPEICTPGLVVRFNKLLRKNIGIKRQMNLGKEPKMEKYGLLTFRNYVLLAS
jgi:hypothetical protein